MAHILSLAALSTSVAAQKSAPFETDTGSHIRQSRPARIPHTAKLSDVDAGRITLAEFARCTVDRKRDKLASVIVGDVDAMAKLVTDDCLYSGELKFKTLLMRGAVYTELYRRKTSAGESAKAWSIKTPPIRRADFSNAKSEDIVHAAMIDFADCVITRDRAGAVKVVTNATASPAQNDAFTALSPHFGPCLYEGQKLELSKAVLEGAFAEVLYRGVVDSAPAQGAAN